MNINIQSYCESNNIKANIPPLKTEERYFKFQQTQAKICEIKKQGDKESIYSQIESYNSIQEITFGTQEYCSTNGIEYIVQKGDILTCIGKEYYGDAAVAYKLMEIYGIGENLRIGQVLFLPKKIGDYSLKEQYINTPSLAEKKEQQEKEKNIATLNQYDQYLEITHKLDYHISSFNPLPSNIENIADTRYKLYQDILNDTNLNIKQKNPNLYNNLTDYIRGEDVFLDWDEELKAFLLEQKSELLTNLPEVQETIEGEKAYRNIKLAKDYFQKRINTGKKDMLSFLDKPLYDYIEAFEQDYLKSVYLNQEFDVGKINGFLKIYEFFRGDFQYSDIKEYIELVGGTFNGLRGLSWRTLKLGTDIIKAANKSALYDISVGEDAFVEGMVRHTFSFEKYIDNVHLNQFIKGTEGTLLMAPALASGMLDGYMDAAATIGMFVMEPEQLLRDMKKVPELMKMIDIKTLYQVYSETFDGNPEELYPAIMYTLAYIYVLMIAMPFAAPNLFSKSGELVGRLIGKVRFRKMLKDLKVEKQKFENTSKEFQVFNAKANKKQEILGKIEDLDYKLDKFLAEKEKIWNDLSHINMKQNKNNIEIQKLSDKLTHYKSNPTKSYDDINSIKEIWIRLTNENAQIEKSKFDIAQKAIKNHMDSKKLMDSKSGLEKELQGYDLLIESHFYMTSDQLKIIDKLSENLSKRRQNWSNMKTNFWKIEDQIGNLEKDSKKLGEQYIYFLKHGYKDKALEITKKKAKYDKRIFLLREQQIINKKNIGNYAADVLKYKHSKLLTEKKIVSDAMLSKENILHNQEKFIEESVNNITKRTTTFSQDIGRSVENLSSRLNDTRSILDEKVH